ncbi:uncharacterized protein EAF01_000173 [Botrytis porri]|uniref:BTB domain-containing protein n=1 Tax=Botrytis porri TaxID=87229 RepID=A0A4Z1KXA1_9HELO|nr:uncharacterized protein EAF01_000173 [Botrytis porri]KAF7913767.1 hypothetical protein EAF01_000173 [Botrytis porri]TGO89164.1 hypothetical protein BPOR_0122g00120 [Botrytis porri]
METPLETPSETPLENEKSKILIFILESKTTAPETEQSLYEGPTVTIIVGPADKSKKYIVPQALLCHHSKFSDRALNGPFKKSIEKRIEHLEETSEEFELLLEWIYCETIPWIPGPQSIETIIKFYTIADKFDVPGPYRKAEMSLSTTLVNHWYRMCIESGTLAYKILESAYQLLVGHEVQRLFGKKAAFDTVDGLAIEVVKALGDIMISGFSTDLYAMQCYQDPLTGKKMKLFLNRRVSDLFYTEPTHGRLITRGSFLRLTKLMHFAGLLTCIAVFTFTAQSDFVPNYSTKSSDTMANFNHSVSKMLGSPTEYNSAKNNSQENPASTDNQLSANSSAYNRSPLATLAPPTMNTSTFMSPARSVPATPARSTFFGSSTASPNFESFRSRVNSITPTAQEIQSSEPPLTNASNQTQSDAVNAPPQERAKTTHNIAAQLPANEFTNNLDLFRGPEVLVTAGIQLGVKSYLIPKALLIQASQYFKTAITVETLGQITRETLKIECSILAFDFVVQYLYTGTFVRPDIAGFSSGSQQVTNLIEFYELAERFSLDISDMILDNIKEILVIDRLYLQAEHIQKVVSFPNGQKLRMLFARSCIQAYLQSVNLAHEKAKAFRFQKELDTLDGFAADLMRVYREVADKRTPCIFAESCDLLDGKKFSY